MRAGRYNSPPDFSAYFAEIGRVCARVQDIISCRFDEMKRRRRTLPVTRVPSGKTKSANFAEALPPSPSIFALFILRETFCSCRRNGALSLIHERERNMNE